MCFTADSNDDQQPNNKLDDEVLTTTSSSSQQRRNSNEQQQQPTLPLLPPPTSNNSIPSLNGNNHHPHQQQPKSIDQITPESDNSFTNNNKRVEELYDIPAGKYNCFKSLLFAIFIVYVMRGINKELYCYRC